MRRDGDSDRRRFFVVRRDGNHPRREDRFILVVHTDDDPLLAIFLYGTGGKTLFVDRHFEDLRLLFAIPHELRAIFPARARIFGHSQAVRICDNPRLECGADGDPNIGCVLYAGFEFHASVKALSFKGRQERDFQYISFPGFDFFESRFDAFHLFRHDTRVDRTAVARRQDGLECLGSRIFRYLTEVQSLRINEGRFEQLALAGQFDGGIPRVIGFYGDHLGEITLELGATDLRRQVVRFAGGDETVGPTVEGGTSPAPRFDMQRRRAVVANIEGTLDGLGAPPNRFERDRRVLAHPVGVLVHDHRLATISFRCASRPPGRPVRLCLANSLSGVR